MPEPVTILIGTAIIAALTGTAIKLNWNNIVKALGWKKLAVLGEREVGKTHLIRFLTTGSVPETYKQTVRPEKARKRRFKLSDLNLRIRETRDVSGDAAEYGDWKELFDEADVVLYLFRVDKLMSGDAHTKARVRKDMWHIGTWLEDRKPRPQFFLVGTHCDLTHPDLTALPVNKVGEYMAAVRKLPEIQEAVLRGGGGQNAKVIAGSMKSIPETEALVYQLFLEVS